MPWIFSFIRCVFQHIGYFLLMASMACSFWTPLGLARFCALAVLHRWELPDNYPFFAVVMILYHYVEKIGRIFVTPDFVYYIYDHEKYYPREPVNIHMQSLIYMI